MVQKIPKHNLSGMSFGRLKVQSYCGVRNGYSIWSCKCECGTYRDVMAQSLINGLTKSCGCLSVEKTKLIHTTHGMSRSPEYKSWNMMMDRCTNKNSKDAKHYLCKGIEVCEEWHKFTNFFLDMGEKPSPKHQIERIDNTKGYSKSNCRWATSKQNNRNTSRSKKWIVDGIEYESSRHAAEKSGLSRATILRLSKSSNNRVVSQKKY